MKADLGFVVGSEGGGDVGSLKSVGYFIGKLCRRRGIHNNLKKEICCERLRGGKREIN